MAWGSGSAARSCLEWSELFWETKSGGRQLCYFLGCDISLRRADESSLFPRFRNRLGPASPNPRLLPGQLVPPAWRNRTSLAGSAKGLFVYQRLGCHPPLRSASHSGRGPFLSMAASPLWLFCGIWGQLLYFTPSVGPVDSSEVEFYCSAAGHEAKGRCHEGGAGQWGTREGTWITRPKIPSKHHLKIFPSHGQKRVKPSFEM